VALWRQVADGIERGIADGRFAAGDRLPGETEIAETYRVNRHTVRRALATLAGVAWCAPNAAAAPMWKRRGLLIRSAPARGSPRLSAPAAVSRTGD